jgi:hypothetical protein
MFDAFGVGGDTESYDASGRVTTRADYRNWGKRC